MSEEQKAAFLKKLGELAGDDQDTEIAHSKADDILCEALTLLGHQDLVSAWCRVNKWYA